MNESFGKRVTMLEELVGRLMEGQRMLEGEIALLKGRNEGQNSNENQNPTPDSTGRIEHTETRDPDCSIDLGIVPDHIAEIPPILDHPGTVNTIDPELVERSSHSGSGLDLSVDSAAREPESASAYMDDYGQMYTQGDDAQ